MVSTVIFVDGAPGAKSLVMSEVITQARAPGLDEFGDVPELLVLSLNGTRFEVKREMFFALPESVLICLSLGTTQAVDEEGYSFWPEDGGDGVINVDFSPTCFKYILDRISATSSELEPIDVLEFKASRGDSSHAEGEDGSELDQLDEIPWLPSNSNEIPLVLAQRPSFIVLKEDLEFYVFDRTPMAIAELNEIKNEVGHMLADTADSRHVFAGLRNSQELNSPEYFLMQMLVQAGMTPEQLWDHRERQENTAKVLSMQLTPVELPQPDMLESVYACHKLLLFWRKPAKKCWWDKSEMTVRGKPLVVHCRRVWTLELDIMGLKSEPQ